MLSGMSAPLFTITDLAKVYHMGEVEVHALKQVNLQLDEGQFVVLLGPSGSGKSTLLNIIGGLDVPTSGEVRYRDTVLTRADEAELTAYRRRHVGFVFQFYNLIPSLTAVENVALVTEISDAPMNPDDALRLVNLGEREDHFPAQLSGGEQQRVAIARAIAKRPSVLLCDEPTGALDISTGVVVLEALARVNAEMGTTTVVITHNAAIASMADRVIRLADGRVIAVEDRTERKLRLTSCRGDCQADLKVACVTMRIAPLNRKLFRDLLAMKGQAFAIAMVVAAGVAMYVMYLSTFDSLLPDARRVLRAAAIRGRVRVAQAGTVARRRRDRGDPGRVGGRDARRRQRHAGPPRPRRAGERAARVGPRAIGGRSSTICSCGAAAGSSADAPTRCSPAKAS